MLTVVTSSLSTKPLSSPHPVIIHVLVNAGPSSWSVLLAGLVGGATVLIGVVTTEFLTRRRHRRLALETALWNLFSAQAAHESANDGAAKTVAVNAYTNALAQIRGHALRGGARNSDAIVRKVDDLFAVYGIHAARWIFDRDASAPLAHAQLLRELARLIMRDRDSSAAINRALADHDYPDIERWSESGIVAEYQQSRNRLH